MHQYSHFLDVNCQLFVKLCRLFNIAELRFTRNGIWEMPYRFCQRYNQPSEVLKWPSRFQLSWSFPVANFKSFPDTRIPSFVFSTKLTLKQSSTLKFFPGLFYVQLNPASWLNLLTNKIIFVSVNIQTLPLNILLAFGTPLFTLLFI